MTKDCSSPFVNISTPPTRCNSWAWCPRRRPRAHRGPHPDPPPRRGGGSVDGDWALGDGRALARVLLRFPSGAFALLVGRVLVRRKRPGSASRPLTRILLRLDGGAFTGLMRSVFVGLEGPGAGARAGRGGRQLDGVRGVRRRGGGERAGQGGADDAAGDHRSGEPSDGKDTLGWGQAFLTSFDCSLGPRTLQQHYRRASAARAKPARQGAAGCGG